MAGDPALDSRTAHQQVVDLLEASFAEDENPDPEAEPLGEEDEGSEELEQAASKLETSEEAEKLEEEEPALETAEKDSGRDEHASAEDIQTITQLAERIEADPEWLYNLKVPVRDGLEPISLSELKDAYQEAAQVRNLRKQVEQEREEVSKEKAQAQEQVQQELQKVSGLSNELIEAQADVKAIVKQYADTDWTSLEQDDPGKAALQRQRMNEAYQSATGRVQQVEQTYRSQVTEQMKAQMQKHGEELRKHLPEWSDETVRKQEFSEMSEALQSYGYTPQEISQVYDHRALRMARDLAKLKSQADTAKKTVAKVRQAPKPLKPAAPSAEPSRQTKLRKMMNRAAKSRNPRVKSQAVAELLASEGIK